MSAGNPPAALAGREEQTEQLRRLLARLRNGLNEQSLILWGLRGVGKTVLLLEFESIADNEGWTSPDPIEIRSDTNFRAELADAAYEALLRLNRRKAIGGRLKAFTGLLSCFKAGVSTEGKLEFSFDPSAISGTTGDLERDLTHLFVELGETARDHETGCRLPDRRDAVPRPREDGGRRRRDAPHVAAQAARRARRRRPAAATRTDGRGEVLCRAAVLLPAGRTAQRPGRPGGAAQAGPGRGCHVRRIVQSSGGYPTFIQAYGKEAWNMAPGATIALDDVLASEPIVQSKLDEEFFHVRFEKATPRERRYMAAMADLGDGPYRTSDIAKRLSSRASATSAVRDSLIKKGLIYSPDHGDVDFTVPHFSPFMRRRYPLDGVLDAPAEKGTRA
jgi:hypothetical protein